MDFKQFLEHVNNNNVEGVEAGLSANPDWLEQKDTSDADKTPLIHAVYKRANEVALVLIRRGARGDAEDLNGVTALSYAAAYASRETLKAVLEAEGWRKLDKKDALKETPLMNAVEEKKQENVEELLRWGADAEVKDGNRKTAKDKTRNKEVRQALNNFKRHPLMAVIQGDDLDALWARVS